MTGDDGVRNEPFLPSPGPWHGAGNPPDPAPPPPQRYWWEDLPDPWDMPRYHRGAAAEEATGELGDGDGDTDITDRERSPRRPFGWRHTAIVVVITGTVLIGTGVLAHTLRPDTTALPAPPTPPERRLEPSIRPDSRLGSAPSPTLAPSLVPSASPDRAPLPTEPPSPPAPTTTSPPSPPSPPEVVSFEAEAAELGGRAQIYSTESASGGQAVGDLGRFGLDSVFFPAVTAEPGEYELTFHYLSRRDRRGQFAINGGRLTTLDFPATGEGVVGSVAITVELAEGNNTIWFGSTGRRAPDLDRITIAR